MSFILDALRKSEHERQRQSGPGLAEVAVAAPRPKGNVWATAAIVLLLVNLLAVGVLLLWRARAPEPAGPASIVAAPTAPAADREPMPGATQPAPITAPARTQATPGVSAPATELPPMLQPADGTVQAPGTRNPLELEVSGDAMLLDPLLAERAASVPEGPPAVMANATAPGTVVYESAPGAGNLPGSATNLPTVDDVAAQGGFPEMHLDLHVYSTNAQDRFVFVNKRKYREGETLQEGPLVLQITRDGVVLSLQGRRFILPRQ